MAHRMIRLGIGFVVLAQFFAGHDNVATAQLLLHESFESDGDGSRYDLFDRGYSEGSAGDSDWAPGMWDHNFDVDRIGIQQSAPAKRAAVMWQHDLFEDSIGSDAIDIWSSLVSWAVDGKENAKIGFYGGYEVDEGSAIVGDRLMADGHQLEELFSPEEVEDAEIDLLIHSNVAASTAFSTLQVPLISYSGSDLDDEAIAGIGQATDLFEPLTFNIPADAEGHAALGGKTGTVEWLVDAAQIQTIGITHNGGQILGTAEYEDVNIGEEVEGAGIFVIDAGGSLLGAFNPTPADGSGFLVGAALNKFGDGGEKLLTLPAVDVTGKEEVSVAMSLAGTISDFEDSDYLRIEYDPDGDEEGFVILEEFWGVSDSLSSCFKGLSNADVPGEEGDSCLTEEFTKYTWDIPADATNLIVRVAAFTTWGNEIVAIDDIRIASGPDTPGDYNGNGELDVEDLNLQAVGMANNDPAFDLNGDGATDYADRQFWVSDLKNTWIGDANLDGEFNSNDLVRVFTDGLFETGQAAGWEQGDWNGDGGFDSSDFVAAFVDGGYENGPRPATAAVPEPSSICLIGLGAIVLLRGRRAKTR